MRDWRYKMKNVKIFLASFLTDRFNLTICQSREQYSFWSVIFKLMPKTWIRSKKAHAGGTCPSQEPCGDGCFYNGSTCEDLNECSTFDFNTCLTHVPPTTCSNTEGSFECLCPDGSVADAAGNCGPPPPPGSWWSSELIFDRKFCSDF